MIDNSDNGIQKPNEPNDIAINNLNHGIIFPEENNLARYLLFVLDLYSTVLLPLEINICKELWLVDDSNNIGTLLLNQNQ